MFNIGCFLFLFFVYLIFIGIAFFGTIKITNLIAKIKKKKNEKSNF